MNRYDKYITRFLLTDNCDNSYTDLIEFDTPVSLNKIYEVINQCTTELSGTYTNEDIYNYLDKLGVAYNIIFLGNYETIYY